MIELFFSAQFRSCTRDFYLASSSFNWSPDGDFTCDQQGFHGIATGTPGEGEVTQAAMYIKKNFNIPGLNEALSWLYDTTQVELIQADNDPAGGTEDIYFEGAQLVDSEGYCLTRGQNPIDGTFIMYVDDCVDYSGDPTDADNIDAVKR